ncbi:MAG: hypothetical protein AB8I08_01190 [Sandaracinaceae bacterium]
MNPFPVFLVLMSVGLAACGSDTGEDGGTRADGDVARDGSTSSDGGGSDGGGPLADGGTSDGGTPMLGAEIPDFNGDGTVNILVLGTSRPVRGGSDAFTPDAVASELESILNGDGALTLPVSVVAEDIYRNAEVRVGTYNDGSPAAPRYHAHSMLQYYYWPDGEDARRANLEGAGDVDWDHVIIAADPRIVAEMPGFFAVGVNRIAERVRAGDAQPRLLMVWPSDDGGASLSRLEEHTYRAAYGAAEPMPVVPAGLAWDALSAGDRDSDAMHPTPIGAYVAAASIYAQIFERSASESEYAVNDSIADLARTTVESAADASHYDGARTQPSAFAPGTVAAREILFHQTGTSSEAGVRRGFRRASSNVTFTEVPDDAPFAHFNYGRANRYYEANKQYIYDPSRFDYSFGFPMHDSRDIAGVDFAGEMTMPYGIDTRASSDDPTATDLGIALYMADNDQMPNGRGIPIRALLAQTREAYGRANPSEPMFSAYRDATHMSNELDTASGAFLYTLLTGHCSLADEPADSTSGEWKHWIAHRIGYEMAWTTMHLRGRAPGFRVIPESAESVSVTPDATATLSISFANAPTEEVVVTLSTDDDAVVMVSPTELRFTPENHATPQTVTMTGVAGDAGEDTFVVSSTTSSADVDFDRFVDRWEYTAIRP